MGWKRLARFGLAFGMVAAASILSDESDCPGHPFLVLGDFKDVASKEVSLGTGWEIRHRLEFAPLFQKDEIINSNPRYIFGLEEAEGCWLQP